jgi:hypothetical protein
MPKSKYVIAVGGRRRYFEDGDCALFSSARSEQTAHNRQVGGSNPPGGTNYSRSSGPCPRTYLERKKTMIEKLKNLSVAKYPVEELLEFRVWARMIYEEYSTQKLDHPEWLNSAIVALDQEIKSRVRDERARRLSEAKARRSSLRTTEEKRADLDKEITELEEALQ